MFFCIEHSLLVIWAQRAQFQGLRPKVLGTWCTSHQVPSSLRFLLVVVLLTHGACSDPPPPTDGQVEGALLGLSLSEHIGESTAWQAPFRCARFPLAPTNPNVDGVQWREPHGVLDIQMQGKTGRVAAIADARADASSDMASLQELRVVLGSEKIDILVSLGGMGQDAKSLERVLGALTTDATYVLFALPGDRESVPAHRATVAKLAAEGARIIDGSQYRLATLGPLHIATMPGISREASLIAGANGCLHTEADIVALQDHLRAWGQPALLFSYAPWRQETPKATDFGVGGVHIGERVLGPLRSGGSVTTLVHGMQAPIGKDSGSMRLGVPVMSLTAGSVDSQRATPSALLFTVAGAKLAWKRLPVL